MKKPLGYIAYEGRSRIDGKPIVVIINNGQRQRER